MSFSGVIISILVVITLIIFEVICRDGSNWARLPPIQPNPQSPGISPKYTTPWPALGQRTNNYYNNYNNNNNNVNSWNRPLNLSVYNQNSNFAGSNFNQIPLSTSRQEVPIVENQNVNDDELRSFSENLLNKDQNNAARYVHIDYQGRTTSRSTRDEAPLPLLSIDQTAFHIASIEKMLKLYDNYQLKTTVAEEYTNQERNEEENLLNSVINTSVMEYTRNFLIQKGKISNDLQAFKDILNDIWFMMYPRGSRKISSSGFEHVFLAEIKNNQVSGLHNWLYFEDQEKKHNANYLGYLKKIDLGNKGAILKYHFTFNGIDKPVGSMFIGTSPELEMALYTTCFLLRADHVCPLKMNGNRFVIRTFTYTYRGKKLIGSAFPEI